MPALQATNMWFKGYKVNVEQLSLLQERNLQPQVPKRLHYRVWQHIAIIFSINCHQNVMKQEE